MSLTGFQRIPRLYIANDPARDQPGDLNHRDFAPIRHFNGDRIALIVHAGFVQ